MSDVVTSAGQVAPAAGVAPPAPPPPPAPVAAASPAPVAPPATVPVDPDGPWLRPRLESAKATGARELLAELGAADVATAKEAIAKHNAAIEATKSAEQRAAELKAERDVLAAQNAAFRAEQSAQAAALMAVLSAKDQEAIRNLAGDDPQRQLATIRSLNQAGYLQVAPEVPKPASPIPAPGSSAQPIAAPPPPGSAAQPNHLATYSELQKSHPMAAAHYLLANFEAIQKAKQATT